MGRLSIWSILKYISNLQSIQPTFQNCLYIKKIRDAIYTCITSDNWSSSSQMLYSSSYSLSTGRIPESYHYFTWIYYVKYKPLKKYNTEPPPHPIRNPPPKSSNILPGHGVLWYVTDILYTIWDIFILFWLKLIYFYYVNLYFRE